LSISQGFKTAEAVFEGRVVEITKDDEAEVVKFQVFAHWKNAS